MASGSSSGESKDSRWYFTAEQLANSPSRKCGIEPDTELNFRQQAANLIQCVGQKVQVSQLCINTAIVYMHRFYAFHSFTHFHKNGIAQASLFLAAKVEEQPRKLEHVIKEACKCLHNGEPSKPVYEELALDLVFNENVLLQTLGFDVAIDHPHTHVVKTCHLVKASKDLAQTSYFLASNSLHLTTMCLQYRPQVVACFCIHLACRWSRWEIPPSNEKKDWFQYVDKTVTMELLQKLTEEFLYIFDKCPSRLKNKINSMRIEDPPTGSSQLLEGSSSGQSSHHHSSSSSSSSRHHHSSSHHSSSKVPHSDHHIGKSVAGSGAPDHKPHSIPSSSSSNVNRTRGERPVPPQNSSYVPTITQQHPPHSSSSSNNSISSSSSKTIPPNTHSTSNGRPVSSSNSSSQKLSHPLSDGSGYSSKNRSVIGGNQSMPYGHNQKLDQRHLLKDNMPANIKQEYKMQQAADLNKGTINKADPTALYLSSSRSEAKNNPKQQQIPQQQQPYNMSTNQSTSQMSRNQYNIPIENPPPSTQKLTAEASYKSLDESSRVTTEAMQSTPPKQSKLTSIFSPDYKDASIILPASSFGVQPPPTSSNSSSSRNNLMATNLKMNKDSPNKKQSYSSSYDRKLDTPSKKEKKLLLQQQHQQLQQQQQQEAALNSISRGSGSSSAIDKKLLNPNLSSSSNSINPKKTQNESTGNLNIHTGNSQQSSFISSFEPVVTNKVPTIQNNAPKRPFMDLALSGTSSIDDVVDSRENKIRKLDLDMMDRISPGSKINESKHSMNLYDVMYNTEKSNSKTFVNTVNGIETNPALVSSLLKEMCTDSNKYGTALNASVIQTDFTNNMLLQPPLELLQPKIEPKDEPMSPIEPTATLPQQILQPPPQQTYQHHQIQMQQQIPVQQMQPQQHLSQVQQQQPLPIIQPTVVAPPAAPQQTTAVSTFVAPVVAGTVSNADSDEFHRSKSEKKKKKDKHKHKEKDKSKDREERKKHKKDKDKHKDRHEKKSSPHSEASVDQTAAFETQSRIKITIPKEKINFGNTDLNTSIGANTSFKIKIPKDRIKTELSGASSSSINQYNDNSSNTVQQGQQQSQPPPTNSLKIKISKDVLENYNSSTYSHDNQTSHHSSKKKDRDRDREKSKCSKSDSSKQNYNGNGNNNNNNTSSGNSGQSMNRSSSNQNKNLPSYMNNSQYSSQHHQYSSSGSSYSRSHQQDANNKLNNNFYYPNNNNRVSNNSSTSSTK